MSYAKVVFGLPVEGPFDYLVPPEFSAKIKPGIRVWVSFGFKKKIGVIVSLSPKSDFPKVKPILELIDEQPIIDKNMFLLTRFLSDYYCCSWGEAIETALPEDLRLGKKVSWDAPSNPAQLKEDLLKDSVVISCLLHALKEVDRWDFYIREIKKTLSDKKTAIIILPDKDYVLKMQPRLASIEGAAIEVLYRKQPQELKSWNRIREQRVNIVIGTRSAVFAPAKNLGLIIIEDEEDSVYKQDQVPHYHVREIAIARCGIENSNLILGSLAPTLESFYLADKNKINYNFVSEKVKLPEVKVIDMKIFYGFGVGKKSILSKYLEDMIFAALSAKEKTLLFLNRKGFATFAHCHNCAQVLKCPRCNIPLVYHFESAVLTCGHCNFKMPVPKICPKCNAGYIMYSGLGTERIESELARIFPQARIARIDKDKDIEMNSADIFISTSLILKKREGVVELSGGGNFSLVGVLGIDSSLNRIDYRSTEKVFALLTGLLGIAKNKLVIQTSLPTHQCFTALEKNDPGIFYREELKQRKQMRFPPYKHLCLLKIRGKSNERLAALCESLFALLSKADSPKGVKVISHGQGQPPKLRGNFYYQVLLQGASPVKIGKFIKTNLKKIRHSGIIITVDMDPV